MEKQSESSGKAVRLWPKTIRHARYQATSHMARYFFAEKFVAGKNVCDVACGAGYGSKYLSQKAKNVVGMDISTDAITWAKVNFNGENIRYFITDGCRKWPVEDKFDVITSFETMEHVNHPETFIRSIHEHLLPGGVLILSVPNGPRDQQRTDNPHHLHHFNDTQLKELMGNYFSDIECFSQAYRKGFKHYFCKFLRKMKLLPKQMYFVNNYFLKPGFDSKLKTWVVIAHK